MIIDSWQMQARRSAGISGIDALAHFFVPSGTSLRCLKTGAEYAPSTATMNADGSLRCLDAIVDSLDFGETPSRALTSGTFHNFTGSFGAMLVCKPIQSSSVDDGGTPIYFPAFLNIGDRKAATTRTGTGIFLGGTTMSIASGYNSVAGGWNDDNENHMTLRHQQQLDADDLHLFMLTVDKSSGDGRAEYKRYNVTDGANYLSHSPDNVDDATTAGTGDYTGTTFNTPSTDSTTCSITTKVASTPTVANTVDMQPAAHMLTTNLDFYGLALFDFGASGIPSDWQYACHFMTQMWADGNHGIYPPAVYW